MNLIQQLESQIEKIKTARESIAKKLLTKSTLNPEEIKLLEDVGLLKKINFKIFSRAQIIKLLKNYEIAAYLVLGDLKSKTRGETK